MSIAAETGIGRSSFPGLDQILNTMISLTRLSSLQRVIVAGDDSTPLYLAPKRLGFVRVTTPAICRISKAQHGVGLVASQTAGAEAILDQLSPFLASNAAIALRVGARDNSFKIRTKLQNLGQQPGRLEIRAEPARLHTSRRAFAHRRVGRAGKGDTCANCRRT
jgi:hypothetical protein